MDAALHVRVSRTSDSACASPPPRSILRAASAGLRGPWTLHVLPARLVSIVLQKDGSAYQLAKKVVGFAKKVVGYLVVAVLCFFGSDSVVYAGNYLSPQLFRPWLSEGALPLEDIPPSFSVALLNAAVGAALLRAAWWAWTKVRD